MCGYPSCSSISAKQRENRTLEWSSVRNSQCLPGDLEEVIAVLVVRLAEIGKVHVPFLVVEHGTLEQSAADVAAWRVDQHVSVVAPIVGDLDALSDEQLTNLSEVVAKGRTLCDRFLLIGRVTLVVHGVISSRSTGSGGE